MTPAKRKEIVTKGKAALAMRRLIGWSRSRWIDEVESAFAEAFVLFAQARLAGRTGQRRRVRAWTPEFGHLLARRAIEIVIHPVKMNFDRRAAFELAVAEMSGGTIAALRDHVERELKVCKVRRGFDDSDVDDFWRKAREATRVLTE